MLRIGRNTSPLLRSSILSLAVLLSVSCATATGDATSTRPATDSDDTAVDEQRFEDIELYTLEVPTVVTATRREQKITTVPYAVSVITAEDIRWSGARSVPDALRLAAGVDVAELSYGDAAVSPRGFHGMLARTTLVLVDGRQIFDAQFGGTFWGSWPFQLEDIERIEVIRGPGGVTWGANAVQGAINIITKDPADQLGLTFTAGGGSRGTHKEYLGYAFQEGKLRLRLSGEYEASDGFLKGGSFLRNLDDSYKCGRMNLYGIYEMAPDDTLTFSAGCGLLNGGYPLGLLTGLDGSDNAGSQASFLMARWEHKIAEDNWFELSGFVNDFYWAGGFPAAERRYQQLALQLAHNFKASEKHMLTWGIDSRVDLMDASNADPYLQSKDFVSTAIIGLYLQDQWKFAPRWTLDLGGRIDYEFYGGFQPSARAALSYELTDDAMLYAAVSRAFYMTPAPERFTDFPLIGGLATVVGDREIDVQSLIAYELGYRGKFSDHLDASINLYWHEMSDLQCLSPGLGPPGLLRIDITDLGAASLYGLEIETKYKATEKLTLLANYTFEKMDSRLPLPHVFATDLFRPPKHKFMLGARYSPTDDIHLSSHLYYVDAVEAPNPAFPIVARHVDPYFRLDLRGEYEFWDDRASVAVGVRNLLDPNHYEGGTMFFNDAEVPRMVFAEFRLRLK